MTPTKDQFPSQTIVGREGMSTNKALTSQGSPFFPCRLFKDADLLVAKLHEFLQFASTKDKRRIPISRRSRRSKRRI